nr:hypothetical protein [Tanacetum cinerariifolium]
MAAFGSSNLLARRVIDDLLDFSGETSMAKSMKFFFLQQIAENYRFLNLMPMGDADEVFDTLMCLRGDIRDENSKLEGLNDVIAEADEKIAMKEEHVKTMEAAIMIEGYQLLYTCMSSEFLEVAGSPRLQDRINLMFSRARSEDESFIGLMRDLCFGFRMRLNKNHRLIAELEALGKHGDALRYLDYLREMVVRDSGTLRVLEQLLAGAHVGMQLKDGYVADMQQME